MKIVHLGGLPALVSEIASTQREFCHEVSLVGVREAPSLVPSDWKQSDAMAESILQLEVPPDILHIHGAQPLLHEEAGTLIKVLKELSTTGTKIALTLSDYSCNQIELSPDSGLTDLIPLVSHLFVTSPREEEIGNMFASWSWLPCPVNTRKSELTPRLDPPYTILYITDRDKEKSDDIVLPIISKMRAMRPDLNWQILPAGIFESIDELRDALRTATVFIEDLSDLPTSLVTYEALAHGTTVLSKMKQSNHEEFQPLEYCPLLSMDANSLQRRLVSLLLEPRAFRDLSLRGRRYIEDCHDLKVVTASLLEVYRGLVG